MSNMDTSIIVALITGGLTLLGVIITSIASSNKMQIQLEKNQAVTATQITELTREVREHNNFALRIPVIENDVININKRLDNIEKELKR